MKDKWKLIKKDGKWLVKEVVEINAWSASPEDYIDAEKNAEEIPVHPEDVFHLDLMEKIGQKTDEGLEVEVYFDHMTPMGLRRGLEEYSSIMQMSYGKTARLFSLYHQRNKSEWSKIFVEFMQQLEPGSGETYQSAYITWLEENYEAPKRKRAK